MASSLRLRPGDIPGLPSALAAAHKLLRLASWLEERETKIILEKFGRVDSDDEQDLIGVRMFDALIEFAERFGETFDTSGHYEERRGCNRAATRT